MQKIFMQGLLICGISMNIVKASMLMFLINGT